MVGKRDKQKSFYQVSDMPHNVPEDSFYARMGKVINKLFSDDDLASMYCLDNGAPSLPPSMMCATLLLQFYDNVSDRESVNRLLFDIRWKLALDLPIEYKGFDPTSLVRFRKRLLENGKERYTFDCLIEKGKELGLIASKVTLLSDTTPVKGAGAVMDTFTLIRKGIRKLLRKSGFHPKVNEKLSVLGALFEKYVNKDEKASLNWDDKNERQAHLQELCEDAEKVIALVQEKLIKSGGNEENKEELEGIIHIVKKILEDDIEKNKEGENVIKEGTAKDRIISVTDPEMRHGRKSSSKVINGFKVSVTTDAESEFILDIHDIPANASDGQDLIPTIVDVEKNVEVKVDQVLADGAYGTGENRCECAQAFDDPIDLVSPLARPKDLDVDKKSFDIDLEKGEATCTDGTKVKGKKHKDKKGRPYLKFQWNRDECKECPLFHRCVKSKSTGRSLRTNVNEVYLKEAWERQQSPEWKETYNKRAAVERKIADLVKHGIRETRYLGELKRNLQRLMTGTVVNLKRMFTLCDPWELRKGNLVPVKC